MKNKIKDLNNHLFAQLERLGDENLTDEQLVKEVERGKAITEVSKQIIESSKVTIEAAKMLNIEHPATAQSIASIFINQDQIKLNS